MKPRRRILTKLIYLLAAGATLNVAVAWCLAMTNPRSIFLPQVVTRLVNGTDWVVYRNDMGGMTRIVSWVCGTQFNDPTGIGTPGPPTNMFLDWSRIRTPVLPADSDFKTRTLAPGTMVMSGPGQTLIDEAFGMPFRSLWCGWGSPSVFSFAPNVLNPIPIVYGIEITPPNSMGAGGKALPYGVLWPGFAINTVFYATLLWAPFALRRMIRRRRGQCPACAYPIGQSPVCTECGAAVTPAKAVVA